MDVRRNADETTTDVGRNNDGRQTKRNEMEWNGMDDDYDGTTEQSTLASFAALVCRKEKRYFFLLLHVFF
jgi:hypothetical protein